MKWRGREMPVFRIEPHEARAIFLDAGEPLEAPCARLPFPRLGQGPAWFLGGLYRFRQVRTLGGLVWLARARGKRDAPLLRCSAVKLEDALNQLEQMRFSRVLLLDSNAKILERAEPGELEIRLILGIGKPFFSISSQGSATFRWSGPTPSPAWLATVSDARLQQKLSQMLAQTQSDCAFSWLWLQKNESEKRRTLWVLSAGDWDEMEAVLRAILWQNWTPEIHWQQSWYIEISTQMGAPNADEMAEKALILGDEKHASRPLSPAENQGLDLVIKRFRPRLNFPLQNYSATQRHFEREAESVRVAVPTPSLHDQIEAAIFLREWKAKHFSP